MFTTIVITVSEHKTQYFVVTEINRHIFFTITITLTININRHFPDDVFTLPFPLTVNMMIIKRRFFCWTNIDDLIIQGNISVAGGGIDLSRYRR